MPSQELSRTTRELEHIFELLATVLWFKQQKMPTPVVTIQSGLKRRAYGWFVTKAWTNGIGHIPEINISAEYLCRSVTEIVGTLVHEMVHLSNYYANERDCSGNNYHNRRFKSLAERVLLICERAEDGINQYGWAYTTPSPDLCRIIEDLEIDEDAFALFRNIPTQLVKVGDSRKTAGKPVEPKLKKWSCGCTNVWSAVEVRAFCCKSECGCEFRRSAVFH